MIETKDINGCRGIKIEMPNANLLLIIGSKGYIMCGYLNIDVANKLGDAACVITNVKTFDDVLNGEVISISDRAKQLDVMEGMTGKEALGILR